MNATKVIEGIKWGPPPTSRKIRCDSIWPKVIEHCIATGQAAIFLPDKLPFASTIKVTASLSAYCNRHPDQVRARGFRMRSRTTEDGGMAVWAVPVSDERPRRSRGGVR